MPARIGNCPDCFIRVKIAGSLKKSAILADLSIACTPPIQQACTS